MKPTKEGPIAIARQNLISFKIKNVVLTESIFGHLVFLRICDDILQVDDDECDGVSISIRKLFDELLQHFRVAMLCGFDNLWKKLESENRFGDLTSEEVLNNSFCEPVT